MLARLKISHRLLAGFGAADVDAVDDDARNGLQDDPWTVSYTHLTLPTILRV